MVCPFCLSLVLFVQKMLNRGAVGLFIPNAGVFMQPLFHGLVRQAVDALDWVLPLEQTADDGVA